MADRGGGIEMGSQSALQVPRSKGKIVKLPVFMLQKCPGVSFRKQKYLDPKENRQMAGVVYASKVGKCRLYVPGAKKG